MRHVRRFVVAVGALVVQGLLGGALTEASQTPAAVDVQVDDVNHVITITGRITLYPLCAPRVRSSPSFRGADGSVLSTSPCTVPESVRQQIQANIEQIWNQGFKYDCYDVVVKADVTVDNSASSFSTSPDRLMVGVDQGATTFDSHTHGGPYQPGHTNSGNTPNDRLIPINSTDRPSRWAYPPIGQGGQMANVYAHEFGHVMGLDDSYEIVTDAHGNRVKNLLPGHQPDLMFDSHESTIDQSTIDRLVERTGMLSHSTTKCDYKIDQMISWYHFTSLKCATPEGDWDILVDGVYDLGGANLVLSGEGKVTLHDDGQAITGPWSAQFAIRLEGVPAAIGGQDGTAIGDAEFVKPNTLSLITTSSQGTFFAQTPAASLGGAVDNPGKDFVFTVTNDHYC